MSLFRKKEEKKPVLFEPESEEPVVHKSICTGETTVGFAHRVSGRYRDVRKVSSEAEIEAFCREVGADPKTIRTIY
ncbi:MAG: hypothetical protein IKM88_11365 [Lachnospiraceae bacterium]|nr:hypothetical protein [Clostridiales bacterium]MBR6850827.1 hypothetical protein [Lachnospiraceae bacterium]